MSKTIHIFGCSFSAGYGLNPQISNIPHSYSSYYKDTWGVRIKDFFDDYNIVNHAIPGISNEVNKDLLLKNINTFNKGDIVIFGVTDFKRLSVLVDKDHPYGKAHFNITGQGYRQYLENLMSKQPISKFIPHYLESFFYTNELDHTHFNSAINFYQDFIYKGRFALQNETHFKELITSLTEFFDKLDIKLYAWDSTIWFEGENTATWSDFEYKDYHWSPNGNNFFLGYLLWGIKNNYRFLDLELFTKYKVEIEDFTSSKSLDVYIDHSPIAPMI